MFFFGGAGLLETRGIVVFLALYKLLVMVDMVVDIIIVVIERCRYYYCEVMLLAGGGR